MCIRDSLGLEGDYNGDQVVNAADFTIWSDGQSPDSSAAGYALWADNFNNSATFPTRSFISSFLIPVIFKGEAMLS